MSRFKNRKGVSREELDNHIHRLWKQAKGDRDKFKELVIADNALKNIRWETVRSRARVVTSYDSAAVSTRYGFSHLDEKQKEELARLLSDNNVDWAEIKSHDKFGQFSEKQLRNYAYAEGISINKKQGGKMADKKTQLTSEQDLIAKREVGEISVEAFLNGLAEVKSELMVYWDIFLGLFKTKRVINNRDLLPFAQKLKARGEKDVHKLNTLRGILGKFEEWKIISKLEAGARVGYLCNLPQFYKPEELAGLIREKDRITVLGRLVGSYEPGVLMGLLPSSKQTLVLNLFSSGPRSLDSLLEELGDVMDAALIEDVVNYFVEKKVLESTSKKGTFKLTEAAKLVGTDKDSLLALDLFEADNVLDQKETSEAAKAINNLDDFYRMVKEDRESKKVREVEVSTGDRDSIRIVMAGEQRIGNQFSDENLIKFGVELVKKVNPDLTIVSGLVQGDHKSFQVDRLKALVKGSLSRVSAQIKTAGLLMQELGEASKIGVCDLLSDDDWNIGKSRAIIAMKELLGLRRAGFSALLPTEISRLSGRDYVRFTETQWEYVAPYMHRLGRSLLNAEEVNALNPNLRKDELLLIMIVLLYKKFGHEIPESIKGIVDVEALFGDKKDSKRFVTPDPLLIKWKEGNKLLQFIHNSGYSDVTQNLDSMIVMEKTFRQLQARGVKTPNFVFDFNQERFFGTNVGGSFLFNLPGCQNTLVAAARQHKTFNTQIVGEKSHKQNTFRKEPVSSAITDFEVFEDGRFKFRLMNNAVMQVLENNRTAPEVKERLALFQDIQTGSPQMRLEWAIKAHDLALYGPNPVQHVSYNGDLIHGFSIYMQFVSESRIKKLVSIKSQQAMFEKCFLPFYPAPTVKHIGRVLGNHEWDNLMAKKEGGDPLAFLESGLTNKYALFKEGYIRALSDIDYKGAIKVPYPDAEIIAYSRGRTANSGNPEDGGTAHWPIYTKPIGGGFRYAVQHKWQPFGGGDRTPVDSQLRWVTNMAKAAEGIHVMLGGHYHSFWVAQLADKLLLQMPGLIDQSGLELGFGLTPLSLFCMVEFSNKHGITVEMYPMEYLIDYKCRSPFYKDKNELLVRPKPGSREYDFGFDSPLIKQWEDEVDSNHMDILPKP